jgi:regulator of protease activity HflC (stomatin/prohibitin superfamily)
VRIKVRIRKHQIGLWFRHGDFKRALLPGVHWLLGRLLRPLRDRIQVVDVLGTKFDHPLLDVMVGEPQLREQLVLVELGADERALVWKDGRLGWILGPGRHAFWKRPYRVEVETFDVTALTFEHPKLEAVVAHPESARHLDGVRVHAHERVLLFREGELINQLGPGLHVFWKGAGQVTWKPIDLREQVADVAGQEIMTADKVTLRVNLVATYQVTDPVKAVTVVSDHAQALYRQAQLALRAAVGTRPLDRLLADKDAVGSEVREALMARAAEFGVTVRGIGLRDIILPGDMKSILNQVIEAEKQAEANLIRRREETAAARSQANTAKLLAENPVLARMKELEALQEILRGAKTTFVLGRGELADQIGRLAARRPQDAGVCVEEDAAGDN